jgi:hypothetical protein
MFTRQSSPRLLYSTKRFIQHNKLPGQSFSTENLKLNFPNRKPKTENSKLFLSESQDGDFGRDAEAYGKADDACAA